LRCPRRITRHRTTMKKKQQISAYQHKTSVHIKSRYSTTPVQSRPRRNPSALFCRIHAVVRHVIPGQQLGLLHNQLHS
jgi:hypothetical protein